MNYRHLFFSFLLTLLSQVVVAQMPGHNYTYNTRNLTAEEIHLSVDGKPYLGKEFPMGSNVKLLFEGVRGYQLRQGKAYPRISMSITEKKRNGNVVLEWDNLLEVYEQSGLSPSQAAVLTAGLTVGDPLLPGEAYEWQIEVTEATGKGRISLKYEFQVVGALPEATVDKGDRFRYESVELNVQDVVLEIADKPWPSLDLPDQGKVDMVFKNVQGLSEENGLIHPGMAVRVTDANGKVVLEAADLFADYSGISAERAQRLVSNLTIGHPMQLNNLYTWEAYIWDKNWPRRSAYARLQFRVTPSLSKAIGQN